MEIAVDGSIMPFGGSISPDALVGSTLNTFQWNGDSVIAVSESAVGIITVGCEGNLKAYYRLLKGFAEPALDSAFITTADLAYSVYQGTLYTTYLEKLLVHTIQGTGVGSSITSVKTCDFSEIDCGLVSCNATVGTPYGILSLFVTPDPTSLFLASKSCASQSGWWFPLNTYGSVQFGLLECDFSENSDPSKQCFEPAEGQDTAAMTVAFLYSIDPTRSACVPLPDTKDQYSIYVEHNDFCEFDQESRLCGTLCSYCPPPVTTAPSDPPTAAPSVACVNQFTDSMCALYTSSLEGFCEGDTHAVCKRSCGVCNVTKGLSTRFTSSFTATPTTSPSDVAVTAVPSASPTFSVVTTAAHSDVGVSSTSPTASPSGDPSARHFLTVEIRTAKGTNVVTDAEVFTTFVVVIEGVSSGLISILTRGTMFAENTFVCTAVLDFGLNLAIDLARLSAMEIQMEFLGQTTMLGGDTKLSFNAPTPTSSVVYYTDNRPLGTKVTLKLGLVTLGPSPTTSTSEITTAAPSMTPMPTLLMVHIRTTMGTNVKADSEVFATFVDEFGVYSGLMSIFPQGTLLAQDTVYTPVVAFSSTAAVDLTSLLTMEIKKQDGCMPKILGGNTKMRTLFDALVGGIINYNYTKALNQKFVIKTMLRSSKTTLKLHFVHIGPSTHEPPPTQSPTPALFTKTITLVNACLLSCKVFFDCGADAVGQVELVFPQGEAQYTKGLETCSFIFDAAFANQPQGVILT
jgi:hypothetical protein